MFFSPYHTNYEQHVLELYKRGDRVLINSNIVVDEFPPIFLPGPEDVVDSELIKPAITLQDEDGRGMGVVALEDIQTEQFIGFIFGEVLSEKRHLSRGERGLHGFDLI